MDAEDEGAERQCRPPVFPDDRQDDLPCRGAHVGMPTAGVAGDTGRLEGVGRGHFQLEEKGYAFERAFPRP